MDKKIVQYLLLLTLFIFGLAAFGGVVSAVGVLVKPAKLILSQNYLQTGMVEILVSNASAAPGSYQVTADQFQNMIKIAPAEFLLEPGASQIVIITARPGLPRPYHTLISAVARPLGANGFATASGVKIPIDIEITYWWLIDSLALIAVCLALFFGVKLISAKIRNKPASSAPGGFGG